MKINYKELEKHLKCRFGGMYLRALPNGGFEVRCCSRFHGGRDLLVVSIPAPKLDQNQNEGVGIQSETSCKNCGHSKSRHDTFGGFCKHCNCNEFIESALPPIR